MITDEDGRERPGVKFVLNGLANGEIAELTFRVYAPTETDNPDTNEFESRKTYTNTANLEDEDNKNLIFTEEAGDYTQGENVMAEEEYKKLSETTYHEVTTPVLEALKTSNPKAGTLVKDGDTMTYYIQIKNIGAGVANNIIIKDVIPEFTSYIASTATSDKQGTNITLRTLDGKETLIWIVETLQPNETVTVSFQVRVDNMNEIGTREIKNTAQIKIPSKDEDPNEAVEDKDGYTDTNEVTHTQKTEQPHETEAPVKTPNEKPTTSQPPKTGDDTANVEILIALFGISAIITIYAAKRKKMSKQ